MFNNSIPIINKNNTKDVFFDTLIEVSNNYEESIIHITQSYTFLSGEYFQKYAQYLQGDFSELLDQEYYKEIKKLVENATQSGLKTYSIRIFEIIRYFILRYAIFL